ncbi:hypothetical protein SNE40_021326 [Patella caerulea]
MGCGRSKYNSGSIIDDQDIKDSTRKKSHKQLERKENKEPVKPINSKGGSAAKKDKLTSKKTEKIENSPTKSQNPWINGSSQSPKLDSSNGFKSDRLTAESRSKTAFKDRQLTGNKTNVQITGSQLEFFRMLDERIEQGKDYSDE